MRFYDYDECVLLDNKRKKILKIEPTEISGIFSLDSATEIVVRGILRDDDWRPMRQRIDYSKMYRTMFWEMPKIKDVIFNDPATIVFWADGTKTVVQCQDGDTFDPEKGLAMAITKKALGNKGNYCNELKKWLTKDEEKTTIVVRQGEAIAEAIIKSVNNRMNKAAQVISGRSE